MKKITSVILAIALIFALAVTAMAATNAAATSMARAGRPSTFFF